MVTLTRPLRSRGISARFRSTASAPQARRIIFDLIQRVPQTPAGHRVERILELLVSAERLRTTIKIEGLANGSNGVAEWIPDTDQFNLSLAGFPSALPMFRFADPAIEAKNLTYRDTIRTLQTMLMRYRWTPTVEDRLYEFLGERLMWDRTDEEESEENRAVQFLLEQIDGLTGPARILRFRRCRECQIWFYALKDHQVYCCEACRKRHFSRSPEFKKDRAEYMRMRYRPTEKERSQKALERAKSLVRLPSKPEKGKR